MIHVLILTFQLIAILHSDLSYGVELLSIYMYSELVDIYTFITSNN